MSSRGSIRLLLPLASEDWALRMARACIELERCFPGAPLNWARSSKDGVPDEAVKDVKAFFTSVSKTAVRWFSVHNGERYVISRSGETIDEGQLEIGGRFDDRTRRVYGLIVSFSSASAEKWHDVLATVGDAVAAFTGGYTQARSAQILQAVQCLGGEASSLLVNAVGDAELRDVAALLDRLPRLHPLAYGGELTHPFQPERLSWLNYWSRESCEYLGFPHPTRDADLLAMSQQTTKGSWIVKLTNDPLDVSRPDHLAALLQMYERFPGAGVRV